MILGLGLLVVLAASVGGVWYGRERERQASYEAGLTALAEDRYADALTLAGAYPDDPDHDHLAAQVYLSDDGAFHDAEKGLALQRAAAEAGQMRAAYFLASYLLTHDPDETQQQDALRYLTEAAECGMPDANWAMGDLYFGGKIVPQEMEKAREYYEVAAWTGIAEAQYRLALTIAAIALLEDEKYKGESIEELEYEAMVWLYIAKENGMPNISEFFTQLQIDWGSPLWNKVGKDVMEFYESEAARREKKITLRNRLACKPIIPLLKTER